MQSDEFRFEELYDLNNADQQFARRRTRSNSLRLFLIGIVSLIITAGIFFSFYKDVSIPIIGIMAISFCIVCMVVAISLTRVNNQIFSREFENALFAGAANAGHEFLFIVKQDQSVVYFSPACKNYFLVEPEKHKIDLAFLLEKCRVESKTQELILGAIQRKEKMTFGVVLCKMNGLMVNIDLIIEPLKRPKGFCVIKAIQQPESFAEGSYQPNVLNPVFDEMPTGIYKASSKGLIYYVNPSFARMLGYSPAELTENSIHFRDLIFANHLIDEGTFNEQWQAKVTFRNKQGQPITAVLKQLMLPPGDAENGLLRCGFVVKSNKGEDIDNTSETGQQSSITPQTIEHVWQQLLEASPIAIATIEQDATITENNAAFRKLAAKKITDEQQYNLLDMLNSESQKKVQAALNQQLQSYDPIDVDLTTKTEGSAVLYINPIETDSLSDNTELIIYLIETTDQKQLESRVVHSQRMQAVGQLAGGVAHDFNNLLTAMIGFCDLLLTRHPAGDPSFADLMQIKQNANRAANLVRQLLAFSRKQTLQPETLNPTDILTELSNLLRRLIGENITLTMQHERDLWAIKADSGQLEQVIINLAVNARDAMDGNGTLDIQTQNMVVNNTHPIPSHYYSTTPIPEIEHGDYVAILVKDTGCGMPKAVAEKVFEPFFTTKGVGEGTGLGLATVLGIVEQSGGHILIESKVNQGTTFMILLKRHEETQEEVQQAVQEKSKDLTGSGRILLVEDEAPVRMFGSRALSNKGYDVLEAEDAEMALDLFESEGDGVDLIISDVMMPGISGPEMVQQIREKYPDIKVIFISGYGEDEFGKTFGDTRSFHFLPKPFTLDALASKVKDVMES